MIGLLRGRLLEKRSNQVILDIGGVGYLVAIPLSTFATLGELHAEVTLLIHTHVREDALALYGFLSHREKHLFELLLGASGVGPSLALKILSGMNVEELVPAIRTGDLASIASHTAQFYEHRLSVGLDRLMGVVGPAAIVLVSIVIGALIISIMSALLSITDLAQ